MRDAASLQSNTMRRIDLIVTGILLGQSLFATSIEMGSSSSEQTVSRVLNPFPGLNLTAEQLASLRKMDKENRRRIALALAYVHTAREDLESVILTEPADEATIYEKSAAVGKAVGEFTALEAVHDARFLQLLTPGQRRVCRKLSRSLKLEWIE
jgi:Spy/CpxP family protein refolding chaperone